MGEEKSIYFFGHEDWTSSCMVYMYGTMDGLMQGEAPGGGRKMRLASGEGAFNWSTWSTDEDLGVTNCSQRLSSEGVK